MLDITQPRTQTDVVRVFVGREHSKLQASHDNDAANELQALNRVFAYADPSVLVTFGLYTYGELTAFIICEKNDENWCTGHFWKANTAYRGIYRYLMFKTAETLLAAGYTWLNIEQDLGIDGLRRMKQSFKPSVMLKKYTVTDAA